VNVLVATELMAAALDVERSFTLVINYGHSLRQ